MKYWTYTTPEVARWVCCDMPHKAAELYLSGDGADPEKMHEVTVHLADDTKVLYTVHLASHTVREVVPCLPQ